MTSLYDEIRIALHSVWSRRWLALAVAWAICVVGWLVVALIPNKYESRARMFVQMQQMLPDAGKTDIEQAKELDSIRQTLASSDNLAKVVRGTDLGIGVTSDKDVAGKVDMLRQNIKVVAQQDNLFEITATFADSSMSDAANAKMAQAIVQKLIDIFVEENLAGDRQQTSQTLKFLDQQLGERAKQLEAADAKRMAFEQKYMGLLPGSGSMSDRMDAARGELGRVESDLAAAQSALNAINGQLAGTPANISSPGMGGSPSALSQAQSDLAAARGRGWTESHPDVQALERQIATLRGSGGGAAAGGYATPNPMYMSLKSMQAERQATVAALSARRAQLRSDMGALAAQQADDPQVAGDMAQVNRDYDVLKAQYDKLLADREAVRLRGDAQSETDSVQFRIIDPPSAPRVPTAPNRPLLLFGVLIVGLGGGVSAAFALGQLQTTYPTASRLEQASGLPVIGAITETLTAEKRALRVKRRTWFLGGSGGLVGLCLLLVAVEFVQRGMAI